MVTSTLNSNAPMFVPSEYRQSSSGGLLRAMVGSRPLFSFRHYCLCECFSDPQPDIVFSDNYDTYFIKQEENKKKLITLGLLEWSKSRFTAEIPRYGKKVPKIVNVKVSTRHIQQPR